MAEKKKYSLRVRLLASLFALLIALLLAEGAMRVRQLIKYGTSDVSVHNFEIHEPSGLRVPKPGVKAGIDIDSRGFRNPELTVPKPERTIRLAFLGASTTYCAEATSNETTWPHLVCERLRKAFPSVEFDYVNAGVPGYSVEHSSRNLESRVRELSPDVLFVYHAANDISQDTRDLARTQGLYEGKAENPSSLAKVSVLWAWIEKNARVRARMAAAQSGEGRLEIADPGALAAGFRGRLTTLLQDCSKTAPVVAVATFSRRLRADQDPATRIANCNTTLYYMPYMSVEGLLVVGDAYDEAIRTAARAAGVLLVQGENSIPGDGEHFADSVHFTDAGCRRQADRVTKALLQSEALRKLVEARSR